mmetsp:Transcript_3093/g.6637  ORF Transcript_3093/g.6637 Transcript_3093/m.6637 type:complete len:240 (+) Transcript_3093:28-747(+)
MYVGAGSAHRCEKEGTTGWTHRNANDRADTKPVVARDLLRGRLRWSGGAAGAAKEGIYVGRGGELGGLRGEVSSGVNRHCHDDRAWRQGDGDGARVDSKARREALFVCVHLPLIVTDRTAQRHPHCSAEVALDVLTSRLALRDGGDDIAARGRRAESLHLLYCRFTALAIGTHQAGERGVVAHAIDHAPHQGAHIGAPLLCCGLCQSLPNHCVDHLEKALAVGRAHCLDGRAWVGVWGL